MALKRTSGGGSYFKPKDHMNDIAILVEPIKFQADVESTYQGQSQKRDIGTADFTIFGTQESLDKGEPSDIMLSHRVTQKALAGEIGENLGDEFVAIIKKVPMGGGQGYVFRSSAEDVSDDTFNKVSAYLEKRNAATEAAMADVPDFD